MQLFKFFQPYRNYIKSAKTGGFCEELLSESWEWQIRSAKAILGSLLKTHGESLDDESLLTVMTEVEGILNSRPLTVEVLNHPTSLQPLSPVNILTMKSKVVSPPPGEFPKPDIYSRKLWGHIQHIANEFWSWVPAVFARTQKVARQKKKLYCCCTSEQCFKKPLANGKNN